MPSLFRPQTRKSYVNHTCSLHFQFDIFTLLSSLSEDDVQPDGKPYHSLTATLLSLTCFGSTVLKVGKDVDSMIKP